MDCRNTQVKLDKYSLRSEIIAIHGSCTEGVKGLSAVKGLSTRVGRQECEIPIGPRRGFSLGSRYEIGGGTSAAGSSDIPVPAAARILQLGVFVPGYTRDILISPDLLFASFLPLASLSFFLAFCPISFSLFLYTSCFSVFFLFFLLPPSFFSLSVCSSTLCRKILSSYEDFSNQIGLFEHRG